MSLPGPKGLSLTKMEAPEGQYFQFHLSLLHSGAWGIVLHTVGPASISQNLNIRMKGNFQMCQADRHFHPELPNT